MRITIDTHTHTVASGHALSTLRENAIYACKRGLEGFCCTDHGQAVVNTDSVFIFKILTEVPDVIEGVRLFKGCEVNILNAEGDVDLTRGYLKMLDFAIASLHDITYPTQSRENNTRALVNALKNPCIDVVGHPGNPRFPVDVHTVVCAAKEYNKLIEINAHSISVRAGSHEICKEFVRECKRQEVRITVSSDAHSCYAVGEFAPSVEMLKEGQFPYELVVNRGLKSFADYLEERRERIKKSGQA